MMNTTKATAFWQSKKPNYCFQNSAQFILNGRDNSKRHSLGATASCGACGDAMVTVLEGKGKFTIGGKEYILEAGQTIIMPKDIPHSVFGEDKFKMILVVSF
mgnify:CR=1 FL=1